MGGDNTLICFFNSFDLPSPASTWPPEQLILPLLWRPETPGNKKYLVQGNFNNLIIIQTKCDLLSTWLTFTLGGRSWEMRRDIECDETWIDTETCRDLWERYFNVGVSSNKMSAARCQTLSLQEEVKTPRDTISDPNTPTHLHIMTIKEKIWICAP